MELRRFDDLAAFSARIRIFLLAHAVQHGPFFEAIAHMEQGNLPPYLAAVDAGGDIVAAAVMTPPQILILSLAAPDALPVIAADLRARYGSLTAVYGPSEVSQAFAEEWRRVRGQTYRRDLALRIYRLTEVIPVTGVLGALRRATESDRDLLIAWITAFGKETHTAQNAIHTVDLRLNDPNHAFSVWVDTQPVSMAAQDVATPCGVSISTVYTPPEFRRMGYASAIVATLSQQLLASGHPFCLLDTDLDNPNASRIYQAIGYMPVCDIHAYSFRAGT